MPKLDTPDKIDKNRRVAWGRYYALQQENERLRNEIAWLRANRRAFYRLFLLIRRNRKVTPEITLLAADLRLKMLDADLLRVSGN